MTVHLAWPGGAADVGRPLDVHAWNALPAEAHRRCELVEGTLLVAPFPNLAHQRLVADLYDTMRPTIPAGYRLLPGAEILCEPGAHPTVRVPDLVVSRADVPGSTIQLDPADVVGVVEVLSPSTRRTDRVAKVHDYAEAGIGWYLIAEPGPPARLTALVLVDGGYEAAARDVTYVDLPGGIVVDLEG